MLFSKNFRVLSIFALIAAAPHAVLAATPAGDSTITSKRYVDNKIPADSTAHLLVTPQASGGNATKRAITTAGANITNLASSSATGATNIPTAYAVKEAIGTATSGMITDVSGKQDKDNNQIYKVGYNGGWENAYNAIGVDTTYLKKTDNATTGATQVAIDTSKMTTSGTSGLSNSSTKLVQEKAIANALALKQDKLVAGTNITIASDGKTISATDTTYDVFDGASANAAGSTGLVPAPAKGDQAKFLRADGTWVVPTDNNTTYSADNVTIQKSSSNQFSAKTAAVANGGTALTTGDQVYDFVTTQGYITNAAIPTKLSEFDDDIDAANKINNVTLNGGNPLTVTGKTVDIPLMGAASSSAAGSTGLVPAPAKGDQAKFLRADGTWVVPTNTTYSVFTGATANTAGTSGLVKAPSAGDQGKFLRGDGTWAVDNNTTYSVFTGANGTTAGTAGLVKAPAATDNTKFLKGDGTWATPTNTTYSVLSQTNLDAGTETTGRLVSAKLLRDNFYTETETDDLLDDKQNKDTAVTHTANTAVGSTTKGVYVDTDGTVKAMTYSVNKDVPANAVFTDTTYSTMAQSDITNSTTTGKLTTGKLLNDNYQKKDTAVTHTASTAVGSATKGVYVKSDGTTAAMTYSVNANVPANAVFTDTTYDDFTGANGTTAGANGLVPAPAATDNTKFLKGDGTWATPTNTTYDTMAQSDITNSTTTGKLTTGKLLNDNYQKKETAVTHTASTAVGSTKKPVYIAADGTATEIGYTIEKSVPANAVFTDTTYSAMTSSELTTGTSTTGRLVTPKLLHDELANKQNKDTAVTHTASTAVGSTKKPVYIASDGTATEIGYTIEKSVPANAVFTDTTYSVFTGANGTTAGTSGLVKAPAATDNTKFLKGDGTWGTPTDNNTTYSADNTTLQLDGTTFKAKTGSVSSTATTLTTGKNVYDYAAPKTTAVTHTANTAVGSTTKGVYVDTDGTVKAMTHSVNADVPANAVFTDTTYSVFTGANGTTAGTSGLVKAPAATDNTKFLKGDGTWGTPTDNNTTYSADNTTLQLDGTTFKAKTGSVSSTATTLTTGKNVYDYAAPKTTAVTHTANTAVGSTTKGVYVDTDGTVKAMTHSVNADVPANAVFTDTTYDVFDGASADAAGSTGLVPAPAKGDQTKFLRADGTWGVPTDTNTTYGALTQAKLDAGTETTGRLVSAKLLRDNFYTETETDNLLDDKQNKDTAVTHTASTAVGSTKKPVYIAADGTATEIGYTIEKSVPANAVFTDTTYSVFTGANGTTAGTSGLVKAPAATDNTKFLKGDGTWATPTNTTYSVFTGATANTAGTSGLVKAPSAGDQGKFLRGDGTWAVDNNTTYSVFTGANGTTAGTAGLVKAPAATDNTKFLKGDGTWGTPTNTTYNVLSQTNLDAGTETTGRLVSAKLLRDNFYTETETDDLLDDKQNKDTAVTHTASTAVGSTKKPVYIASDGTATEIGYTIEKSVPANAVFTDTTYSVFTGANGTTAGTSGLVKAPAATDNTKFLKGDGTWGTPTDTNTTYSADNTTLQLDGTTFKAKTGSVSSTATTLTTGKNVYDYAAPKTTAVTHTANTAVGSTTKGVYVDTDGTVKAMTYSVNANVPSTAEFTDTTYTFATGSTNGAFTVTPEGGSAQTVSVYGWSTKQNKPATAEVAAGKVLTYNGTGDANGTNNYSAKYIQVPVANNAPNGSNVTVSTLADIWVE